MGVRSLKCVQVENDFFTHYTKFAQISTHPQGKGTAFERARDAKNEQTIVFTHLKN